MDRHELLSVLYQGIAQLGQSRAALQHERTLLDILQHAVGDPAYIESLRSEAYAVLRDTALTDFEKDTVQFIVT
ncbi:MAG: hypothetical protein HYR71_06460 [Chloroflexi bacterium]|nr:hypothetical protein [Chloroflexota bacterium]